MRWLDDGERALTNTILTLLSAGDIQRFTREGYWGEETIYQLAGRHAAGAPDRVAVREHARAVTFAEIIEAADRLAADLHGAGLKQGDRVAVWLPSRIETAIALLACSRNGYVCCPSLHRDHTVAEIAELIERMRAAALIVQPGYGADAARADITAAVSAVGSLKRIYTLSPPGDGALFPGLATDGANAAVRDDPNTLVYLAYTSGTTGQPKGVMHSDNTLLGNTRVMSRDWGFDNTTVFYSLSPLSHNLGFGAAVMALTNGAELVIHDLPRGKSLADRIVETGTTFIIGVPTHAIDLLAEMRQRGMKKLGAVKGFRVSGAPVPPVVASGLIACGVVPQSGFGMTEAGSHHYTLPDDPEAMITDSSGRACDGYEVRIFSRENPEKEIGANEIGQIGGRGASLMLGYFGDQAATESSFNAQGFFLTGDLGFLDDKGYLRITGRKKDVIIRGGHNIFPAKIENLALRHVAVDKAAAIPIADERLGERVCLVVSLKAGATVEAQDLLAHLDQAGLSRYDMPEYFHTMPSLPLTPSGKILKRDIVRLVEAGEIVPEAVRFGAKGGTA